MAFDHSMAVAIAFLCQLPEESLCHRSEPLMSLLPPAAAMPLAFRRSCSRYTDWHLMNMSNTRRICLHSHLCNQMCHLDKMTRTCTRQLHHSCPHMLVGLSHACRIETKDNYHCMRQPCASQGNLAPPMPPMSRFAYCIEHGSMISFSSRIDSPHMHPPLRTRYIDSTLKWTLPTRVPIPVCLAHTAWPPRTWCTPRSMGVELGFQPAWCMDPQSLHTRTWFPQRLLYSGCICCRLQRGDHTTQQLELL